MSDPSMIEGIQKAVTIPVMAELPHRALRRSAGPCSHSASTTSTNPKVLTAGDESYHVDKWAFTVPFVCGATNLGEALRRIGEGRGADPLEG
jgi:pyridoxal 5'-phosphate synthase pdxS subunit